MKGLLICYFSNSQFKTYTRPSSKNSAGVNWIIMAAILDVRVTFSTDLSDNSEHPVHNLLGLSGLSEIIYFSTQWVCQSVGYVESRWRKSNLFGYY